MAKETTEQKLLKRMQKGSAPVAGKSSNPKLNFSFSIHTLNQLLILGIILCGVGLAYELQNGMSLLKQNPDFSDEKKQAQSVAQTALPSSKTANYYLDQISSRNIFKPYEAQKKAEAAAPQGLAARMSKFKLVGVAWLDLPESASIMVEDTGSKTTYFLKQGEQLEGVTVKTIYTDRAVFSNENEETTIKL